MNLDKKVERTAKRPLASGELKPFDVSGQEVQFHHIMEKMCVIQTPDNICVCVCVCVSLSSFMT